LDFDHLDELIDLVNAYVGGGKVLVKSAVQRR